MEFLMFCFAGAFYHPFFFQVVDLLDWIWTRSASEFARVL